MHTLTDGATAMAHPCAMGHDYALPNAWEQAATSWPPISTSR
jgi:hypothetical protein